jgi:hypothetical protein
MTDSPPPNPKVNDAWVDGDVLKFFDGSQWVPYAGPPAPPPGGDAVPVSIYRLISPSPDAEPEPSPDAEREPGPDAEPEPGPEPGPDPASAPEASHPGDTPAEDGTPEDGTAGNGTTG